MDMYLKLDHTPEISTFLDHSHATASAAVVATAASTAAVNLAAAAAAAALPLIIDEQGCLLMAAGCIPPYH